MSKVSDEPCPGNLHLSLGLAERTVIHWITSPRSMYEAPSMRQTHVSSETVSRSKPSFVLLESRPSLSLFPQHLNVALPRGGAQTGVESLGKLFLLLSESVVTWCLARRKVYIQTAHKGHGTISSRGEMKPRSLQGVCEPAHPRLPS